MNHFAKFAILLAAISLPAMADVSDTSTQDIEKCDVRVKIHTSASTVVEKSNGTRGCYANWTEAYNAAQTRYKTLANQCSKVGGVLSDYVEIDYLEGKSCILVSQKDKDVLISDIKQDYKCSCLPSDSEEEKDVEEKVETYETEKKE